MSKAPEPGTEGVWSDGVAILFPETRAAWRSWLVSNHAAVERLWLVLPKKGSGLPGVSYDEAVEEALCFAWIDSRPSKVDEARWLLQFTPRKPGSVWSKPNKQRVEALLVTGLMAAPGLAAVERAKRDGSWSALDSSDALELPVDLLAALERDAVAAAGWERFAPSTRKPLLFWVADAKRPKTRADRIARIVQGAKEGRSPLAWRGRDSDSRG